MPKLWTDTLETHRREVRDAILETTAALVDEHGLLAVTMSQIAEAAGIGRATLYKYFPDVEAIVLAWHDREISAHLEYLADVRDGAVHPLGRLEAVLGALALINRDSHRHHHAELAAFLHRDEHLARADQQLRRMIRELLREGTRSGEIRDDVSVDELTTYCLHALSGARNLRSEAAVRRLLRLTMDGLRSSA